MLTLLPKPNSFHIEAPCTKNTPPTPSAVIYTLLRHGRGLTHEEASRNLGLRLDGPHQAA